MNYSNLKTCGYRFISQALAHLPSTGLDWILERVHSALGKVNDNHSYKKVLEYRQLAHFYIRTATGKLTVSSIQEVSFNFILVF